MTDQWKVETEIKTSSIINAGTGRFFCKNYPKGTIVRVQKLSNPDHIIKYNKLNELNTDTETLIHFAHSKPHFHKHKYHKNSIFINVPFMNTNHSNHPNIKFIFTKNNKYTILTKNVAVGDEMLQDYSSFSKINWFEDYLTSINKQSCRQLGITLKHPN
tara:strand:+ start:404 stop:880 length:477 start_codon:yes stop_codon:yes gene_type:complete